MIFIPEKCTKTVKNILFIDQNVMQKINNKRRTCIYTINKFQTRLLFQPIIMKVLLKIKIEKIHIHLNFNEM